MHGLHNGWNLQINVYIYRPNKWVILSYINICHITFAQREKKSLKDMSVQMICYFSFMLWSCVYCLISENILAGSSPVRFSLYWLMQHQSCRWMHWMCTIVKNIFSLLFKFIFQWFNKNLTHLKWLLCLDNIICNKTSSILKIF